LDSPDLLELKQIAYIRTQYMTKFGVPRQAGVVSFEGTIELCGEYAVSDALRGLEDFDYIWLIWGFSHNVRETWTPTVRPPRLGGSRREGVFATRSSFRPNNLALSSVRLLGRGTGKKACTLRVQGMDMVDGTPIYDIKPYVTYADVHADARDGWVGKESWIKLKKVHISDVHMSMLPRHLHRGIKELLAQDPRPAYRRGMSDGRIYWVPIEHFVIYFTVEEDELRVVRIRILSKKECDILIQTGHIADDDHLLGS
ncbi:MAG: tRNA (N6-threonylcarbamoyladenosine(37)-N6)-methyltransferase TrmO, partial [Actinomycetaceae bacterium]|nr:tRNA (N6-threonylcarbamoyladenosine(37)-N6)-methyltransferase TrmO [Actinomycetaceae bacterium]